MRKWFHDLKLQTKPITMNLCTFLFEVTCAFGGLSKCQDNFETFETCLSEWILNYLAQNFCMVYFLKINIICWFESGTLLYLNTCCICIHTRELFPSLFWSSCWADLCDYLLNKRRGINGDIKETMALNPHVLQLSSSGTRKWKKTEPAFMYSGSINCLILLKSIINWPN